MKSKAHILVVEDKSLIYKRIKMILVEENYSVSSYCPSVAEAIASINSQRPDLVLLDIDLKGEHNGIYLGGLLQKDYHIPFIYVTDLDDDQTFYEGLRTKHGDFISKKDVNLDDENEGLPRIINTKPHLDTKRLIRAIQTILEIRKKRPRPIIKDAILAFVDYVQKTKEYGHEDVSQVPVTFKEIAYFTSNSIEIDKVKSTPTKTKYIKMIKNNTRICTWDNNSFVIPENLSPIYKKLPPYFVRISDDYIVNISDATLDGRINGRHLKIRGQVFSISDRFKPEVEQRFEQLYQ